LHAWSVLHVGHGDNVNEGRTKEHAKVITYLLFKKNNNNINALIPTYIYENKSYHRFRERVVHLSLVDHLPVTIIIQITM